MFLIVKYVINESVPTIYFHRDTQLTSIKNISKFPNALFRSMKLESVRWFQNKRISITSKSEIMLLYKIKDLKYHSPCKFCGKPQRASFLGFTYFCKRFQPGT